MKVTKYTHSCLLIEKDGHRVLIDPGNYTTAKHKLTGLGHLNAVLYTHKHSDHLDESILPQLKSAGIAIYGNSEVAGLIGQDCQVVQSGRTFRVASLEIMPHDLPHCLLADGTAGPMNTGYIFDNKLFHSGDGVEVSDVQIQILAAPMVGPSISFYQAFELIQATQAKQFIPMHGDGYFKVDVREFEDKANRNGLLSAKVLALQDGQSIEL